MKGRRGRRKEKHLNGFCEKATPKLGCDESRAILSGGGCIGKSKYEKKTMEGAEGRRWRWEGSGGGFGGVGGGWGGGGWGGVLIRNCDSVNRSGSEGRPRGYWGM